MLVIPPMSLYEVFVVETVEAAEAAEAATMPEAASDRSREFSKLGVRLGGCG